MDNMIPMGQQMAAPKTSQTEMMISRQAQEVQGAIVMAKKFPRDEYAAMERIKRTCQRATLAEQAIYSYPRGGQTVMGPSIRLAEALAQNWGNIDYGVIELEQKNGACQSITKTFYHADVGNMNFLHEWGYYIQGAVYQRVVEINTGKKLPFFIAAVSKEKEPDIQVIACEQSLLDDALAEVESNVPKILALKNNEIDPIRCEQCDYCKHTKVLKVPIWSSDLIGEV